MLTKRELFELLVAFGFIMTCGYLIGFMEGEASGIRQGACIGMAAAKERQRRDVETLDNE